MEDTAPDQGRIALCREEIVPVPGVGSYGSFTSLFGAGRPHTARGDLASMKLGPLKFELLYLSDIGQATSTLLVWGSSSVDGKNNSSQGSDED